MKGSRGRGFPNPRRAPRFEYFLETREQPVAPGQLLWRQPLPLSRSFIGGGSRPVAEDATLSIGDYFGAVRSFLEGAGREAIAACLERCGSQADAAASLRIFLAKHGEYYHPCRVEADVGERLFCWVVNVAVSAAGKSLLPKEVAALERLNRECPVSYVPEVYAAGTLDAGHGRSISLFLGQWFPDFHEFHLTTSATGVEPAIVLWDAESGHRYLDLAQTRAVYYEVARILTHYFSLSTGEGIAAWHHAAGDFVVKASGSRPEARLITVRDYRPLFQPRPEKGDAGPELKRLLETLLIFLLNLGIRNRLDRLDGTGEMVWSGPAAVEATVAGMLAGLAEKPPLCDLPLPLEQIFRRYLAACSADELLEMCREIAATVFPPDRPERLLLENRLPEHADTLAGILSRL